MNTLNFVMLTMGLSSALAQHNGTEVDRIVGGKPARKGEFPHIVLLKRNGRILCGGSIVNRNWIVTAAHCAVFSINGYTIVAGEHKLNENEGDEQVRNVSEVILHPNYNEYTHDNDVALMKVSSPFAFNRRVKSVKIAKSGFTPARRLRVAGWGTLSSGGNTADVLMKVRVPFVSTVECREAYGDLILDGMLCAGTAGRDSCQGDSGGPLMSRRTLVGIVSWGIGCGYPMYPGVYASVPYYSSWILHHTS